MFCSREYLSPTTGPHPKFLTSRWSRGDYTWGVEVFRVYLESDISEKSHLSVVRGIETVHSTVPVTRLLRHVCDGIMVSRVPDHPSKTVIRPQKKTKWGGLTV